MYVLQLAGSMIFADPKEIKQLCRLLAQVGFYFVQAQNE